MQPFDKGPTIISMLSASLGSSDEKVSRQGGVEERTYHRFGLKFRRRRYLPLEEDVDEQGAQQAPPDMHAAESAETEESLNSLSDSLLRDKLFQLGLEKYGGGKNGHALNGHAQNGHSLNGHAENGHAINGIAQNGIAKNGTSQNGHVESSEVHRPAPPVAEVKPVSVSVTPVTIEDGLAALAAQHEPPALEPPVEQVPEPVVQPPPLDVTESGQFPVLSGKTVGVIGFSPEDGRTIGAALAAQFCSFLFLTHADAEFRKGSTNGCDLLILSAPSEWTVPGSLHPTNLLKTKKPVLMIGERVALTGLVVRNQGGLRELAPTPWIVQDVVWRAATLMGRVQEPKGRAGSKNQRNRVVIGDESAARALVHAVLAQEGMECHVADNGVDTLALARAKHADAVIVDVSLPGLDGFQVLAEVRRDPALKDAVVILLTARQAEADVLRGFGLGANDYVTKPFSPMELAARLKRFLVKKQ
jgi:CheY-like chemotaxis protein